MTKILFNFFVQMLRKFFVSGLLVFSFAASASAQEVKNFWMPGWIDYPLPQSPCSPALVESSASFARPDGTVWTYYRCTDGQEWMREFVGTKSTVTTTTTPPTVGSPTVTDPAPAPASPVAPTPTPAPAPVVLSSFTTCPGSSLCPSYLPPGQYETAWLQGLR
jgi:hypothetical protein